MVILNTGTDREVAVRVALQSEALGREFFDSYESLDEIVAAVRRLVESSAEQTSEDGMERIVAVAIVPKASYGDESGYGFGLE